MYKEDLSAKEKFLPETECKTIEEMLEFYEYFYPHETTFAEMKQANPELFRKMQIFETCLKILKKI